MMNGLISILTIWLWSCVIFLGPLLFNFNVVETKSLDPTLELPSSTKNQFQQQPHDFKKRAINPRFSRSRRSEHYSQENDVVLGHPHLNSNSTQGQDAGQGQTPAYEFDLGNSKNITKRADKKKSKDKDKDSKKKEDKKDAEASSDDVKAYEPDKVGDCELKDAKYCRKWKCKAPTAAKPDDASSRKRRDIPHLDSEIISKISPKTSRSLSRVERAIPGHAERFKGNKCYCSEIHCNPWKGMKGKSNFGKCTTKGGCIWPKDWKTKPAYNIKLQKGGGGEAES